MTRGRRRLARCLTPLLGLLVASCRTEPVAVLTGLEIIVAEGDGQFGNPGRELTTPLRAIVRSELTQQPTEGITVSWSVEAGSATVVSATTTTDEAGSVAATIRLGSTPEDVEVRATVVDQPSASATFLLHAVAPPVLTDVSPTGAAVGDTISLTGSNFSPLAEQNVVLFSGMRGRVVSATESQLLVEVPTCLPVRPVEITVQLGVIASDEELFTVTVGGPTTTLGIGDPLDIGDEPVFDCVMLDGSSGEEYLAIAYSVSTVGAARHPFQLAGLSSSFSITGAPPPMSATWTRPEAGPQEDAQSLWDQGLRLLEEELVARERGHVRVGEGLGAARSAPASAPTVGTLRTFNVWTGAAAFEQVSAVAQYVGSEVAIFVDEDAPSGGFTTAELEAFATRFDDVIHPEVTTVFGDPSDLDKNGRVIVLFTPVVNGLTPRGSSGFIGGFFFGNDLLPENEGSNEGEVFYALVPDPDGVHSDPRPKQAVLDVVPAVLAHEFQHMVQFNERFLQLDAGQEALWLSEGLAQMAEELVARRYDGLGDGASAEIFRSGARARAARYLADTQNVSLIVSTGQGSLAERGAGFLFLLYLTDQEGVDLLGRLSTTTRTGVANVEAEVGRRWPDLLADWWSATYLDGPGPESGRLVYPTMDLRGYLGGTFPLLPTLLGPESGTDSGELWSSSAAYYLVTPDSSGSLSLRLAGEGGGESTPQASLRLRIIRIS